MGEPELVKLPVNANIEDILMVLERDGGLIIKGLISQEKIATIAEELKAFEEPDQEWRGAFFPQATKRILGVVGKSPALASEILMHPLYQEVCARTLTFKKTSRYGENLRTFECKPIANASTTFDIGPGVTAQQLHRDDGVQHLSHPLKQVESTLCFRTSSEFCRHPLR